MSCSNINAILVLFHFTSESECLKCSLRRIMTGMNAIFHIYAVQYCIVIGGVKVVRIYIPHRPATYYFHNDDVINARRIGL